VLRKVLFRVMVLAGLLALPAALPVVADPSVIQAGRGVGGIRLGHTLDQVRAALGPPARVTASPNDPNARLLDYPSRGLAVFLGSHGGVIGVVVNKASWRTPEGLAVGAAQSRVLGVYGPGLWRGQGNLTYPARGLAFSFQAGRVQTIYVFQREDDRALMGDRLIEPGRRVGGIKIGDAVAVVEEAWGRADQVLPLGRAANQKLYRFKEEALGLVVCAGRIEGMILETGDFITREGVKVGSSRAEVLRVYGRGYRTEPERIWYDVRGIGFWFQGDRVRQIQVVSGRR